ncbi:MAG TPA: hypothetical protein VK554_05265, partial [Bradyrhizobium sp.]|nr:hypothetical protein [Bradyrhizobium sp.]
AFVSAPSTPTRYRAQTHWYVNYLRVVDLDIRASKSDICSIGVVTILERAGRTRACSRGLV